MLGFISILILLLIVALVWSIRVKEYSEGNKFIRLLPYWVIAYGVSVTLICPVAFFRFWEHNIELILMCFLLVFALVFALLIIAILIVTIIKKQYRNAGRIVGIGVLLIIYTFIVSLFAGMGKRHPIPEDMEYYEPFVSRNSNDLSQQDSITISRGILLKGQLGMYSYMASVPAIPETGEIYLKLYETTSNLPLSEVNVKYNSTILVEPSDTAVIYQMKDDEPIDFAHNDKQYFTIKEGSWGDYYAARVELWYQPVSLEEPQLLKTAIYKIEGWSR